MDKDRIIVYPYDAQFCPILRHKELFENYEIVGLVSPMGWGFIGKDAGDVDDGKHLGMLISNDFDKSLELCSTVLFSESRTPLDFEKYIMPNVLKCVEARKNIIFTISITNDVYNTILNKCTEHGVSFRYYNYRDEQVFPPKIGPYDEVLYDIQTPVIFVLGTGDRTNKFEIQLALRDEIQKMGYRLSQIGTRAYCELLGFHSFPSFMYSSNISEIHKIILFNCYVKNIEKEESPDVIIIGIPGGVMPFNNTLTNKFGVLAYEVSQAVTPDTSVFSCHYADYKEEYFTRMMDSIRFRLGCKIDCFNISNVMFDWSNSNNEKRMIYTSLDAVLMDEKLKIYKELDTPVFNVLNSKDAVHMAQCLINMLSEYAQSECI